MEAEPEFHARRMLQREHLGELRKFLLRTFGVWASESSVSSPHPPPRTPLEQKRKQKNFSISSGHTKATLEIAEGDEGPKEEVTIETFNAQWDEKNPFGDQPWHELRGPYGETILDWIWHLKLKDCRAERMVRSYTNLTRLLLLDKPELAAVRCDKEPYTGMTLLHLACASGDQEIVELLTSEASLSNHVDLDRRTTGQFIQDMMKLPKSLRELQEKAMPTPLGSRKAGQGFVLGASPLEVTLVAGEDNDAALAIIKLLLVAGAQPVFRDDTGKVLYTLLHVVASGRWGHVTQDESKRHIPNHLSKERTDSITSLLIDPSSDFYYAVDPAIRNSHNLTPLQVAAMFGNRECFVDMLDHEAIHVSQWGRSKEMGFPLEELDSAASDTEISALELMALYKRVDLLSLGLISAIIDKKWKLFGHMWLRRFLLVQFFVAVGTAIVCLDDTEGYHAVRWYSRLFVLVVSIAYIFGTIVIFVTCASSEPWFRGMSYSLYSRDKVDFWNILAVRNVAELGLMALVVITAPQYTVDVKESPNYIFWWHSIAAVWWLLFIMFALRYFELFQATGPLAFAIHVIVSVDMIPFCAIYLVIFVCTAVALRVSTSWTSNVANDMVVGTFVRTVATLGEGIFGPDVSFRPIVQDHPKLAAGIFVGFTWITLIMMTMLVAVFSDRYTELRQHVQELFLFRRAVFTISLEKLFPQWYHRWGNYKIGIPLGGELLTHYIDEAKGGMRVRGRSTRHFTPRGDSNVKEASQDDESQPLMLTAERWFIWHGKANDFTSWREPQRQTQTFEV